jgi:hypothetical protein
MKSFINISTALALALTLSACGGGGGKSNNTPNNTSNGGSSTGNTNGGGNSSTGNGSNGGGSTSNQTNSSTGNGSNNTNGSTDNTTNPNINCEGGDVINGFVMPPCPDQKLNDSTLLGIDSNNNGVRDDVERWLITRYKDHHRIVTEIGFQGARAHQFMLANPDKPEEARQLINGAQACNEYFSFYADELNEPRLLDHDIFTYKHLFDSVQLNTKDRISVYLSYDRKLSGGVYSLPELPKDYRALCTFDANQLLGK